MYNIKNLTLADLVIPSLGITLAAEAYRDLDTIGSRTFIQDAAEVLNDMVYTNQIIVLDADLVALSQVQSVQIFSNGYDVVHVNNEVSVNVVEEYNNYYFLKDEFKIKRGKFLEKEFKGRVKTLEITPDEDELSIIITTGDGVVLPAERLKRNQTLEFNFDGDLLDPTIHIYSKKTEVKVRFFIEGFNNEETPENLQRFVDTWYDNEDTWVSLAGVICLMKTNLSHLKGTYITQDVLGNILYINSDRNIDIDNFYKIYEVTPNNYVIAYLYKNKWKHHGTNKHFIRCKNIRYIQFNDQLVDLTTNNNAQDGSFSNYYYDKGE